MDQKSAEKCYVPNGALDTVRQRKKKHEKKLTSQVSWNEDFISYEVHWIHSVSMTQLITRYCIVY